MTKSYRLLWVTLSILLYDNHCSFLFQSNEVKSSYHMELEGFKRLQAFLASNGLDVGKLITDRHLQLAKYVRENSPTILHTYDVWHLAKSMLLYVFSGL